MPLRDFTSKRPQVLKSKEHRRSRPSDAGPGQRRFRPYRGSGQKLAKKGGRCPNDMRSNRPLVCSHHFENEQSLWLCRSYVADTESPASTFRPLPSLAQTTPRDSRQTAARQRGIPRDSARCSPCLANRPTPLPCFPSFSITSGPVAGPKLGAVGNWPGRATQCA